MFQIKNKVALITGGCGGIGTAFGEALLESGARGVVLADINEEAGKNLEKEYLKKYGPNKLIFVKTDVTRIYELRNAFDKTIEQFNQLDMVFNNAGILVEVNVEKIINVNLISLINGVLIARVLLSKYKAGAEAVIVNTASVAGLLPIQFTSIYGATKAAIIHYSRAVGVPENYEQYKTKVVTICPGVTDTPILPVNLLKSMKGQSPTSLASEVMEIIQEAENGSVWVVDEGKRKLINFPLLYEFPE